LAVTFTGVLNDNLLQPEAVSPVNTACASLVPVEEYNSPVCVPNYQLFIKTYTGNRARSAGTEFYSQFYCLAIVGKW